MSFDASETNKVEYLLKILMREKKGCLINEWLREIKEPYCRPYALRALLRAAPETNDILEEFLKNEEWEEAAMKCEQLLIGGNLEDELSVLWKVLPKSHSKM